MSALPFDSADPADLFEVLSKLGEGSYGSVYKALDKRDGKLVAIKVLEVENEDTVELQKEINILKECDCEWIVRYKGSYRKDGNIWIVMEFCGAGSLCDLMAITERTLNEEQIAIVMRESLHGLEYLHAKRKIHRDIKSGNILINHAGDCKLADFGVSAELATTMSKRKTVIGTPYWMAPEVLQSTEYNGKADIWSLAITAIELAVGEPPHSNVHPMRCLAPEVPVQMADGKTKPASLVRVGDLLAGTHGPVPVLRAPRDGETLPTTDAMYAVQYQLPTGELLPPFKVNAAHELTFRVSRPMQMVEQQGRKFCAFDATATPMQAFEFGVAPLSAPAAEGASEADAEAAMWHAYLDAADSGSDGAARAATCGQVFERTAAELHKMLEQPGQADAVAEWAGGIYRAPGTPADALVMPRPFVVGASHAASAAKVRALAAAIAADGAVLPEHSELLMQPVGCAPLQAGDAARLVLCLSSPPAADTAPMATLRQALSEAGLEATPEAGVVATALPAQEEAARAGMVHILGELRPQRILAMGAAARAQWSRVAAVEGVSAARTSVTQDGSLVTSFTYTPSAVRSVTATTAAPSVEQDEEKKCEDESQSGAFEVQVHHVRDPRSAPVSVLVASFHAALCPSSSSTQVARLHSITLLSRPGQEFVPMEVGGDKRYQLGVGITTHNSIFIIPNSDPPTLPDPSKWSADFNDFLKVCLVKNPDKRPTATELLATHPFILKAKSKAIIAQLVDECMQEIDEYRAQEAAEAANAAANPPPEGEAGQENAAGGTMSSSYSSGTMVNTGTMVHNGNDTGTMRSPASYEAGTMVFNQGTMMQAAAAHATAGMGPGDSGTMVLHATTPNNAGSSKAAADAAAAAASAGAGVGGAARAKYEEPSYMRHIREASSKYGAKSGTGMGSGTATASGSASQTGTMLSAAGGSAAAAAPAPVTAADFREPLYRAQRRYDAGQLESLSVADLKASIAQLEKGLSAEKSQLEALYSEQKKQLKLAIEKKEKKK